MAHAFRALVVAVLCIAQTRAHGGSLHGWDWTTPGYNNTRMRLATASNFTLYDPEVSTIYLPGAIPFFPTYAAPAVVNGSMEVWEFLDNACRETTTLMADMVLSSPSGKLISNTKVYAYGMIGSCAAGVQDIYRNNATLGDNRGNMLWVGRESETNENGTLKGSAPNIFFPRKMANAQGPAVKSILLYIDPQASPLLCADLVWDEWNQAAWAQKVASCKPGENGSGYKRLMRKLRA